MSNYIITTNFAAKDGLTSGNPAKLILGAQHSTEYNNIAIAIATKYDSATTTIALSGALSAGTLSVSSASTVAALTASGLVTANAGLTVAGAAFTSRGITDNATATALLIGSDGGVTLGGQADEGAGSLNATALYVAGVPVLTSAAAGSLTGATLAVGVVNSSLTSVGTLTSLAVTGAITSNGGVAVPPEYRAFKSAVTSRNTTTTLANDPDLTIASVATGVYAVELLLQMSGTTTGTQGLKFGITGTAVSASGANSGFLLSETAGTLSGNTAVDGILPAGPLGFGTLTIAAGAAADWALFKGVVQVTTAGSITLQWAQQSSSANNTNLWQGSSLVLRRLN
jgi:hypothetical protein